jgi:replicative DNA helicase
MATVDIDLERGVPANTEAERTILGAILLSNVAYYEAAEHLVSEDFTLDSHRRIFLRMGNLMDAQRVVDLVTLAEEMARCKEIEVIGGVSYLAYLTEGLPRRPHIESYIRIVKEKSTSRQLMNISKVTIMRAADQVESVGEVTASAIEQLQDTLASDRKRSGMEIADIVADDTPLFEAEASAPMGSIVGASLFTPDLSAITGGIQKGELCLLCARPHQGKTEAAIQTILRNAQRGLRVHVFSLEMKSRQIIRRMLRYMARVPVQSMRDPRCLNLDERDRLRWARQELVKLPIVIDDTHELTVTEFRSRSILAALRWKADLIVCDYAQLLLVPKAKNGLEEAKKQAETLRHIARDYCRTLALAQLRRAPPNDLNRYPDIEDIYGSSAFEQAAQMILMLHRERHEKRYTGNDTCIIGKVRELQGIESLGIEAKDWGGLVDRYTPRT